MKTFVWAIFIWAIFAIGAHISRLSSKELPVRNRKEIVFSFWIFVGLAAWAGYVLFGAAA